MEEKSTFEGKGIKGVANYYLTHTNNKKAITLIALVITIVVLIILAGVAINLTLGDSGIFSKAKYAKGEYLNASQKEEYDLAEIEDYIENYRSGENNSEYSTDEKIMALHYFKWVTSIKHKYLVSHSLNI